MGENTSLDIPDEWVTNTNVETHFSFINNRTDHVLVITPTKSAASRWRVKGLQGFETEAKYPVFKIGVDENKAIKLAIQIMETIAAKGDISEINTVDSEPKPETNNSAAVNQPDESSNESETSSDNDWQADLTSFL